MKKAAIIFLALMYAFSTTGIALKADYCCERLTSIKLVLADGAKDKEGCCKVKYQSFKVKDTHAPADVLTAPALHHTFIHTLTYCFDINNFTRKKNNQVINVHAPPLYQTTPVYISNCVFRI